MQIQACQKAKSSIRQTEAHSAECRQAGEMIKQTLTSQVQTSASAQQSA